MDQRRLKVLSIYFLRIIICFVLIWVPAYTMFIVSYMSGITRPIIGLVLSFVWKLGPAYAVGILLLSIQAIVSTSLALMKPDERGAVLNLLTLSVCCNNKKNKKAATPQIKRNRTGKLHLNREVF